LGPSILARNEETQTAVLFDASPDIRQQLERYLPPLDLWCIDSIFITHGHIGHYWGLPLLGKEGPDIHSVRTYAPPDTVEMLVSTPAISLMESRGNIHAKPCDPRDPVRIGSLTVECFYVPHRQDVSKTVGFLLHGHSKSLIYIPDIDDWTPEVVERVYSADVALLDGTFYSAYELGGFRDQAEVAHPPVQESLKLFRIPKPRDDAGTGGEAANPKRPSHRRAPGRRPDQAIYYTHLNHSNPAGLEGPEREAIRKAGLDVAFDGMKVEI
jgi:pyrroloquinoline quinone biosynthesis protein B